jgi:hypothetical protein
MSLDRAYAAHHRDRPAPRLAVLMPRRTVSPVICRISMLPAYSSVEDADMPVDQRVNVVSSDFQVLVVRVDELEVPEPVSGQFSATPPAASRVSRVGRRRGITGQRVVWGCCWEGRPTANGRDG